MGGIFSKRRDRRINYTATLKAAQIECYLRDLVAVTRHAHCGLQIIDTQEAFTLINTHFINTPQHSLLLLSRHALRDNLLFYNAETRMVLHFNPHTGSEPFKNRLHTDLKLFRLPKSGSIEEAQPISWCLTAASWLLCTKLGDERDKLSRDWLDFVAYVADMLNLGKINLDDCFHQLLNTWWEIPSAEEELEILTAQKYFWRVFDDERRKRVLQSPTLYRHRVLYLFDFSRPYSDELLKDYLQHSNRDSLEGLLKERLSYYEVTALLRRLCFHGQKPLLPFTPVVDEEQLLTKLIEQWSDITNQQATLPWQQLREQRRAASFAVVLNLFAEQETFKNPVAQQQLLSTMLYEAMLAPTPGEALTSLFGGNSALQFQLNLLYPIIDIYSQFNPNDTPHVVMRLTDLSVFSDLENLIDNPWFAALLTTCLCHTEFDVKQLFFWLVTRTLPDLPTQSLTRLAKLLLRACHLSSNAEDHPLRIFIASSLLCFNPDIVLPLLLDCNADRQFYHANTLIARSVVNFCRHHHFPLLSFFIQYAPQIGPLTAELMALIEEEGVKPTVHADSIKWLLASDKLIPTELASAYLYHLLAMVSHQPESLHNAQQFLFYCQLLDTDAEEQTNVFTGLFTRHKLPLEPALLSNLRDVILYTAAQMQMASDGMDAAAFQENCAPHLLLLTDFMSFLATHEDKGMVRELAPVLHALAKEYRGQLIGLTSYTQLSSVLQSTQPDWSQPRPRKPRGSVTLMSKPNIYIPPLGSERARSKRSSIDQANTETFHPEASMPKP